MMMFMMNDGIVCIYLKPCEQTFATSIEQGRFGDTGDQ